ncbi:MAG: hypothetical protein AVDCRST_MAG56-5445 [uncultured Cytophagales bacterium]|uniref:Uncharacterized protein n=1 Tax=uncultured Cytophagales bacterium TaxID=158755 RepID=A0A6J4KCQ1_9SPHI|nr:MAG: hypothetical protein AVDCRST_MAG56-5445 [uncultured Cytophagales bacterium]
MTCHWVERLHMNQTRQASHGGQASRCGSPPRRGRGWVYRKVTRDTGITAGEAHAMEAFAIKNVRIKLSVEVEEIKVV